MKPAVDDNGGHNGEGASAWVDSDDERIVVSLASNPRLRKLRHTEAEDVVSGREYIKRLQQQFERLYPCPGWANPQAGRVKRRKSKSTRSPKDDGSASDMSMDGDDQSAPTLKRLLQDNSSLLQNSRNTSTGRGKLRPETLDIQRSKDVGAAQPVNSKACQTSTLSTDRYLVLDRLPDFSPLPSSPPFLWSVLDAFLTPYISSSTPPKSASHIPPYPTYPSHHILFPT